eukprot:TRINITY_DN5279_c1_g1_i3.p1 TRINITY_DN5279_c1_g1~~TRINITY_DN5279_c1_g1_i3.p1  ORF type:complete len:134 (+),score=8.07 TRINITY_DN5279_c1_g1_i3:94-495(+)
MILTILVYLSYLVLLAFATICLASGLIYLAELVEEYSTFAKRVIKNSIFVVIAIHIMIAIFENLGLKEIAIGIIAHIVYFQLLRTFPHVQLYSFKFALSVVSDSNGSMLPQHKTISNLDPTHEFLGNKVDSSL